MPFWLAVPLPVGKMRGQATLKRYAWASQLGHQPNVVAITVVVVACHVAGIAIVRLPGRVRERVPDRRTAAVLARCALYLVRG